MENVPHSVSCITNGTFSFSLCILHLLKGLNCYMFKLQNLGSLTQMLRYRTILLRALGPRLIPALLFVCVTFYCPLANVQFPSAYLFLVPVLVERRVCSKQAFSIGWNPERGSGNANRSACRFDFGNGALCVCCLGFLNLRIDFWFLTNQRVAGILGHAIDISAQPNLSYKDIGQQSSQKQTLREKWIRQDSVTPVSVYLFFEATDKGKLPSPLEIPPGDLAFRP